MNKNLFRRVFSKRHGMLVAVSETVKSAGKRAGETSAPERTAEGRVVSTLTAIALALMAFDAVDARAQALPTGGQVTAGQATISQPNTNTMNINQASQRAVLDWNTFNIGQGNTVQFNQPNAQAQALNRVTGAGASNINGSLLANGQVLIQNANGVLFGKNAVVNVGSLLATTKSIDSLSFMNGDPLQLKSTGTQAGVINEGDIQAQGYVTLMGDQVRNSGSIATAPGGQVVLAAGDSATVALPNGQGISLVLDHATANALVENTGHILSQDGAVLITARGKDTLLNTVVNLAGVVRAGTVVADAGKTGDVTMTGTIDASNTAPGAKGGTVVLSGDRVGMFGNASINVTGDAAGGKVVLGGDSLHKLTGTEAEKLLQDGVAFANFTQVDQGARIDAGAVNGDGGFVETSGHSLEVKGRVTASAPNGKGGEWLIDPTDVYIDDDIEPRGYDGSITEGFSGGSNTTAVVVNTAINDALNNGTSVTITTASAGTAKGNIHQYAGADIAKTSGGEANLSLIANGNITLDGNITSTSDKLNLNLTAAAREQDRGSVTQAANTVIDVNGGDLRVSGNTAGGNTTAVLMKGSLLNVGGGEIQGTAKHAPAVNLQGNLTQIGNGTLNITGRAYGNGRGGVLLGGTVSVQDHATLNVRGSAEVQGPGVQTNRVRVLDNATLNINGTGVAGVGIWSQYGKFEVEGNGVLNMTGRSEKNTGIHGADISAKDNATVTLNGTAAKGGWGARLNGNLSGNANLTVLGSSGTSFGVVADITASDKAAVDITGTSVDGVGASAQGRFSDNATFVYTGQSTNDAGLYSWFNGLTFADNASIDATGTSVNGNGMLLDDKLSFSGTGTRSFVGTSTNGTGVELGGNTSLNISDGTVTVHGSSNSGAGISINGEFDIAATAGELALYGSSEEGTGVIMDGKLSVGGSGDVKLDGTSRTGTAVAQTENGSIDVSGTGSLDVSGKSTEGTGVDQGGNITVSDGGSATIEGESDSGTGIAQTGNGSIDVSGTGSLDVSGKSTEGTGVDQGGNITVSDGGSAKLDGESGSGTGIAQTGDGSIDVSGTGSLDVSGKSTEGTGVDQGGKIVVNDGGSAKLDGESGSGTGIAQTGNGSIDVSGTGSLDVSGKSTEGIGVDQGGKINVTDGGTTVIEGTSLDGTGVAQTGEGSINVDAGAQSSIAGTSKNGKGLADGIAVTGEGESTVADVAWPVDTVPLTPVDGGDQGGRSDTGAAGSQGSSGSSGSSSSSSSTAAVAGAVGAVGLGGALAYFWDDLAGATWHLSAPQPLSVESGDAEYWAGAQIADVEVDPSSDVATVKVKTATGESTMQLAFRDGADGVKHFFHEDAATKTQGTLSLNTQTREFFYVESGLKAGKPYTVKANGWLKPSQAETVTLASDV